MYYEQIKAEVVKCCPEIMELKFGCEVINKYDRHDRRIENPYITRLVRRIVYTTWVDDSGQEFEPREPFCEILGSPIELHHILRTIERKLNGIRINEPSLVRDGKITLYFDTCNYFDYNLALPLASQSEETLKAIAELLSKK